MNVSPIRDNQVPVNAAERGNGRARPEQSLTVDPVLSLHHRGISEGGHEPPQKPTTRH